MSPADWFSAVREKRTLGCSVFSLTLFLALCPGLAVAGEAAQASTAEAQAEMTLKQVDVMPRPARIEIEDGSLPIAQSFSVTLTGYTDPLLRRAAQRFLHNLSCQTGIPISEKLAASPDPTLLIATHHAGKPVPELGEDESYSLDVTNSGAKLSADTPTGILRGLETFLQLVKAAPDGFAVPALHVQDHPRFPWRGLTLDVSRHFMPLDVVRHNLDAMAAVKMNVLHLHLSDNQGFRVESRVFPRLEQVGSGGLYYTQAELRGLIAYARDRGIRIVPEFDMPGHSAAWFVGYPRLASEPGPYEIEREWGVFDPAMDPTREETYKFLDQFIAEMAALFPDSYLHLGGDEVNGKQWDSNPKIQAFMRVHSLKNNRELQQYFTARVQKIVSKHHKIMVGWDEILAPGMAKDIVIQSWRGQKSLAEAAQQGYRGLLSSGYYLDDMSHASQHYLVDPIAGAEATLTSDQESLILGGEACMWAEFVSSENVESRIWPRAAAVAERLWSPPQVQDVDSMYRRLDAVSWHLEYLGLTHASSYHAMLGRMLDTGDHASLEVLAGVLEPVSADLRQESQTHSGTIQTSQTPLNRMVDAVPPESERARRFAQAVNRLTASNFTDRQSLAFIRSQLTLWRENDALLAPTLERSFALRELTQISRNLSSLATAGLQALAFIEKGELVPESWRQEQSALVQQAGRPEADLILAIAPAVAKLVEASSSGGLRQ